MRKASTLIGLTLIALAAPARAQDGVPTAAAFPAPPTAEVAGAPAPVLMTQEQPPRRRWFAIGLSLLPMAVGRFTTPVGAMEATGDASFAYGGALSVSALVFRGLSVGVAPQVIFNVQDKVNPSQLAAPAAAREYDLMARVAYAFPIVDTIALYVEVLPGYSLIEQPGAHTAKGLVLIFGGGVAMDLTAAVFANLGVGYQAGFQRVSAGGVEVDDRTRYLRVALGGGVRF
jgi:hypothetical protein